jgi:acyl carrier protein
VTLQRCQDIELKLESFIVDELLEESYDGRDPLATGVVDSLDLEQLAEYIAQEFGVELRDEEMVEQTFESIPTLAALVGAKQRGDAL